MAEKRLKENDHIDLRLYTDDDGADVIGRYIVLKHDELRDLYLIQLREVRRIPANTFESNDDIPI